MIYGIIFLYTLSVYHSSNGLIDTADSSIYGTEPKYLIIRLKQGMNRIPKMLLIGASNIQAGLRPNELQTYFPTFEIHNLAIGSSNVTQIKQIVDLVQEAIPNDVPVVFVLGIWYGLFIDNELKWKGKPTSIETEMLRFGLYEKSEMGLQPTLSIRQANSVIHFLHPFILISKTFLEFKTWLFNFQEKLIKIFLKQEFSISVFISKEKVVFDEQAQQDALTGWKQYFNSSSSTLFHEQFEVLVELSKIFKQSHNRLIIVDLPIPTWHMEGSEQFKKYQQVKINYLKDICNLEQVKYVNLQHMSNNDAFYDSTHPLPSVSKLWSQQFYEKIRFFLKTVD
jgi:hypothetical protein